MRRSITVLLALTLATSACSATSATAPPELLDEMNLVSTEINRALAQLFDLLDDTFEDRELLYQRIIDLRLASKVAIDLDKVSRIEVPGAEDEVARYERFLGDLLLATEALDLGIATDDPEAVALASVSIAAVSGRLASDLPEESCRSLTPAVARDLCPPERLDGYEADLSREMRRFVGSYRPVLEIAPVFGNDVQVRVLAALQTEAVLVLTEAADRIEVLAAPAGFEGPQRLVVDYLRSAAGVLEDEPLQDAELLANYRAIVSKVETIRAQANQLIPLTIPARPENRVGEVLSVWFTTGG
jgi:hypothetical protein